MEFEQVKTPQLKDVELVSSGWINKYLLTYELPDGTLYNYESISRKGIDKYREALEKNRAGEQQQPDAICILPVLPDDSLLLIREFRYAINAWCIATPAGLLEPGETIEECVNRELLEETGYRVRTDIEGEAIRPFPQSGYSSVGLGDENVRVVIAYVEHSGMPHPTPSEYIQTFTLARDDVGRFLDTNKDLIGTRVQLLLEAVRRNHVLRKRLALAQNPITSKDFA